MVCGPAGWPAAGAGRSGGDAGSRFLARPTGRRVFGYLAAAGGAAWLATVVRASVERPFRTFRTDGARVVGPDTIDTAYRFRPNAFGSLVAASAIGVAALPVFTVVRVITVALEAVVGFGERSDKPFPKAEPVPVSWSTVVEEGQSTLNGNARSPGLLGALACGDTTRARFDTTIA